MESSSGGTNREKSEQSLLVTIYSYEIEDKSTSLEVFLFCFAFDNSIRDSECKGCRKPLDTDYVQSSVLQRKETGTKMKMPCIHLTPLLR